MTQMYLRLNIYGKLLNTLGVSEMYILPLTLIEDLTINLMCEIHSYMRKMNIHLWL